MSPFDKDWIEACDRHHTCCWRRPWQLEVNDHGLQVRSYSTLTLHLQYIYSTHFIGPLTEIINKQDVSFESTTGFDTCVLYKDMTACIWNNIQVDTLPSHLCI